MKLYCILFSIAAVVVMAEQYAMIFGTADLWNNYSIASEPCRVYAELTQRGIKAENIIYMSFTSTFTTLLNPFPGAVFTKSAENTDGDWGKYGCIDHIDYTGEHINKDVFLAIISGDVDKVREKTGIQNPKVLAAGPEDTVFTYFIDHGYDDLVMINEEYVYSKDLLEAFETAYNKKIYGKWVWFIEACHSGSMFRNLPDSWDIFVMTSADAEHDANMSYCPPNDKIGDRSLYTCLGGLWDNSYLDYMEDHPDCTIGELVDFVMEDVKKDSEQGVSQFGDMTFRELKLADFVGYPTKTRRTKKTTPDTPVPLPKVPLHLAKWKAIRAEDNSALDTYKHVIYEEAKKEVEVMRLGSQLMGEQNAEKAIKKNPDMYSIDCVRDLSIALVEKCKHTLPLPDSASKLLRTICANKKEAPEIDFSPICP